MAEVTNAELKVGTIRVGTKVRDAFGTSDSDLNSVDVSISEPTVFKIGLFVYVQQEVANPQSVQGFEAYTATNHPTGTVAAIYSLIGNADVASAGTVTSANGGVFGAGVSGSGTAALTCAVRVNSGFNIAKNGGPGTITKNVGVQIHPQTVGAENWALETIGATTPSRFAGSVVIGTGALATTAVGPFLHLPSMPGQPTGIATAYAGAIPTVVDTVNFRVWYLIGSTWRYTTLT